LSEIAGVRRAHLGPWRARTDCERTLRGLKIWTTDLEFAETLVCGRNEEGRLVSRAALQRMTLREASALWGPTRGTDRALIQARRHPIETTHHFTTSFGRLRGGVRMNQVGPHGFFGPGCR